ncbi:MAG TPA: adenylyl-sulfate kinase [Candidatus Baltobacteraceae bacterium]
MTRPLRIVFVGHVDHGKSTTIGRLLHETDSLPDGKLAELQAVSKRRGVPLEWSFVLDALQAERDQAITIDTTRVWFSWQDRRYAIIDAPGHRELVRNMLSGAAEADAAVLVVDAAEGVSEQTLRHAQLLAMLGIKQILVAVNKMDAVAHSQATFDRVAAACERALGALGASAAAIVPISARDGENLVEHSAKMPWYRGATLIETLASFEPLAVPYEAPLRMRVQDVYRSGERRVAVGRIDSGTVRVGERIVVLPLGSRATVRSVERWNAPEDPFAGAGESIGLTFDEPIFVDRGDVVCHEADAPSLEHSFHAVCFWLGEAPPIVGEYLHAQFGPTTARVVITAIKDAIDSSSLAPLAPDEIAQYSIVGLDLRCRSLLPLDIRQTLPAAARLVLLRGPDVVAGGLVESVASRGTQNLHPIAHLVTGDERVRRNGHRGAVVWLTGLSGSGKSTLAMALERRLFVAGANVVVLDGDNVRSGLNSDLGFSPGDRAENIRRIGEVAALFADTGTIVITAFISPMSHDRELARSAAGERFYEVYVKADIATCERRDPKGLYRRARAGEIEDFTGISAPYEAPNDADLVVDTGQWPVERCVDELVAYVNRVTALPAPAAR